MRIPTIRELTSCAALIIGLNIPALVQAQTCPCSIWSSATTPANVAASDPGPVELGVKFRTSQAGFITGIRFYKDSGNSGTHVGKLWSSTGTLLGSANFVSETATGWQQVTLATPVAVAANTTYIASYYAPAGHYSYNFNYFTSGVSNPPLTALADGVDGPNGVFLYASGGGFPNQTYSQGNYWVDVVFSTSVASTWSISGTITSGGSSTVNLTGAATATTTADASGNYTFSNLANGSYTVTPSKTGFTFTPANQAVTISNANATAVNFTAQAVPTWSISGTITSGGSSTVNLTGAATATTTADASGNYTFSGLANGSYTVTPSKTGFTFTPVNRAVTISSANATAVNFTAQAVPTWSISGTITSGGSSTVNLTGAATATTTADASGNYTFSGLANGSYTVTPSKTGFTFTPVNQAVTISNANATAVNFTAQPAAATTSIWSSATTPANVAASDPGPVELGVKFRTSQAGFITGIRFYKDSGNSGTHVGKLWSSTGTLLGSANFVSETATGWQQVTLATPVAVAANTTYIASYYAPAGHYSYNFSYFTSGVSSPPLTALADGVDGPNGVFLYASGGGFPNQTYSQGNYWVDVVFSTSVAATWSISGTITSGGSSTVNLTGAATATTTADASGNYTFSNLANGSYTVTPSKTGFTFTPANRAVTISSANATAVNFTAQAIPTWSISGTITSGGSSTVNLTGATTATTTADASGNYTFAGLANGSYTVTPRKTGFTFTPANQAVTISNANATAVNFTAQAVPTWSISGTITSGASSTVNLTGTATATTSADASGNYTFSGLANGSYTVTPSKTGFTFTPVNRAVTISSANATAVNFTAQAVPTWSISGTITSGGSSTVNLTGAATAMTTADASGNYTFSGLANGSYTVTPSKTGFTFTPANQAVTISSANATAVNFTAQAVPTWSISGTITSGASSTVNLTGVATATTTADASGNYTFSGLANGSYTVTPSKTGLTFTPVNRAVTISSANATAVNFTAQAASTWSISGTITSGGSSTVNLTGAATATTTADASGNYTFSGLANGSYTVTPSKTGLTFTPANQAVTISNANATAVNFTAQSASSCPCSIWTTSTLPGTQSADDTSSVELGVKFRTSQSGYITGLKFFKGLSNTGTHVANLWSSTGSRLATATFSNEGVSGWQQVDFPTPVSIAANTTYVASYFAPNGNYSYDFNYFTSGVSNPPLTALADGVDGPNGVFLYASGGGFPNQTSNQGNYWVDIVFTTSITSNPPTAVSDSYSVLQAQTLSVATPGVLTNDVDPNGYALTATLVTNVSHGTLTLSGSGAFTYIPTPSFIGQDTFTYKASDRVQTSNTATATITVNAGPPLSQVGSWGSPTVWPTVAINSVLMHTGQVLVYEDSGVSANVWDPATGNFVAVPNNFTDLFCSGHVALPDGRILVIGGHGADYNTDIGTADANIFDPTTLQWTSAAKMAYRRWYPTATTLPDGRILAMSGNDVDASSYVTIPEIYNPTTNTWTAFTAANLQLPIYPHMFVLPSGKLAYTGNSEGDSYPGPLAGSRNTRTLDLTTGAWTTVVATTIDGDSVMYAPGKILKAGSSNSGCFDEGASSNVAFTIDLTQASPVWQPTGSMAFPRTHHNLTLLPDGSVLVVGGGQMKNGCTPSVATPVFQAELWSPTTGTWSTLSSMVTPRLYHSTAILLPDGRVLVAGGGRDEDAIDYLSAEIFTPPYLYKGTQPTTTSVPSSTTYGANFVVATPDASTIASVVLMHPSATTHAFDEDQKRVNLTFSQTSGGITVTAPANSNLTPPGYYMLFLVNQTGVPSVASFIHLQ